jgi:hypothetical protein
MIREQRLARRLPGSIVLICALFASGAPPAGLHSAHLRTIRLWRATGRAL